MPSELPNYQEIKTRIEPWKKRLERIESNIQFWKEKSKKASTKDTKDESIRQRHYWELERDYWRKKVNSFETTDYNDEWRNNQLNDTRIISKYALHYLKTLFNHVTVANGKYTSDFRKMLGVQSLDEKKDREKHSHHAIDAAVLSLMPNSPKRKEMLELFYKKEELNYGIKNGWYQEPLLSEKRQLLQDVKSNLDNRIASLDCGTVAGLREHIENNILVNHIHKDQALTPTSRRWRIRGRIVPVRDEQGNILKEADGTPKAKRWIKGDIIRGQLHEDTYFGAIRVPVYNENGKPKKENDAFVYKKDKDGEDILSMVVRITINMQENDKFVDAIIDPQVRKRIRSVLDERTANGITMKDALTQPIWLADINGKEIRQDKNGKPLCPIRHVRCKVSAGRGFLTKKSSLAIRSNLYKSKKQLINLEHRDYKQYVYAKNAGNYLFLLYEATIRNVLKRKSRIVNLFEVAELKIKNINELLSEPFYQIVKENKTLYKLSTVIKVGTRVLLKQSEEEDLTSFNNEQLSRRLYVVYKFNNTGSNHIYLKNHLEARNDENLKSETFTEFNIKKGFQPIISLVADKCKMLVEGKDFVVKEDGRITFL